MFHRLQFWYPNIQSKHWYLITLFAEQLMLDIVLISPYIKLIRLNGIRFSQNLLPRLINILSVLHLTLKQCWIRLVLMAEQSTLMGIGSMAWNRSLVTWVRAYFYSLNTSRFARNSQHSADVFSSHTYNFNDILLVFSGVYIIHHKTENNVLCTFVSKQYRLYISSTINFMQYENASHLLNIQQPWTLPV